MGIVTSVASDCPGVLAHKVDEKTLLVESRLNEGKQTVFKEKARRHVGTKARRGGRVAAGFGREVAGQVSVFGG